MQIRSPWDPSKKTSLKSVWTIHEGASHIILNISCTDRDLCDSLGQRHRWVSFVISFYLLIQVLMEPLCNSLSNVLVLGSAPAEYPQACQCHSYVTAELGESTLHAHTHATESRHAQTTPGMPLEHPAPGGWVGCTSEHHGTLTQGPLLQDWLIADLPNT